jgi:hypothetical protein
MKRYAARRAIETAVTELADVTYIFNAQSKAFLDVVTKNGTTYTFLRVKCWLLSVHI